TGKKLGLRDLLASPRMTAPDADAPIFLVGFMASGKTTVGRLLADRLGWAFADLDELVTRAAGRTVPEIFAAEGEAGFRRRESAAVREAAGRRRAWCGRVDAPPCAEAAVRRGGVGATGGGAACREENLAAMLEGGRVIAL